MDNKKIVSVLDDAIYDIRGGDNDQAIYKIQNVQYELMGVEENFFKIREFLQAQDFGSWDISFDGANYTIMGRFLAAMIDNYYSPRYYIRIFSKNCDYQSIWENLNTALSRFDEEKKVQSKLNHYSKDKFRRMKKSELESVLRENAAYVKLRFAGMVSNFETEFCKER